MIPLELRVHNFMCYRDVPPLIFDGIHLACLTGPNGHGKSALLDAMTWALWGRARARRDDELIHLGESEMEVEFTFVLGGTVYRVLRKRDSTGRGRTVLDLQVRSESGTFSSIAEPGVRATQDALIRLLRMDYETFTNSAFLLQGRADAFTTRTPADRKEILGEILGLGLYDEYEQRAKERVREQEREIAEVDGLLRDIDRELDRRPEYESELAAAEARVDELSAALKLAEAELAALRQEHQALEHQQARLRDLDRRLNQARQEVRQVQAQMAERRERLAQYEEVLARRGEVEDGYARLVAARGDEAAWNERLAQDARLQGRQRDLERAVDAARHELELAAGRLGERIGELERRAAEAPRHEAALAEVTGALEAMARDQEERDAAHARLQALNEESAGLQVRNEQMKAEMEALRKKLDVLQAETGAATCPVCGQDLSDEHRRRLAAEMEEDGTARREAYVANNGRRREIQDEADRLKSEIQQLDRRLAGLAAQQRRGAQLEQALDAARQAQADLATLYDERQALDARLQAGDYAAAEQAELAGLAEERQSLGYDGQAHEEARRLVASLVEFEAAHQRLQSAVERVADERAALADLETWLQGKQASLAEDEAQRGSLAGEVARLPDVAQRVQVKAAEVEDLHARSSQARLVLGGAQQRLDHCTRLAAERERRAADRQRLAEEKAIFEDLRLAFGKRGMQAMIIEAAIPEIEYEANRLLARMTDGRMHVRIETQRETLKGDTVETLDINIADELGTRSYELFSGGEAFRVNFAIRIALSKLLARRAGAQLQMLVIDEGFGTQDAEGRTRLVEAITSIQDDFSRILVITHIEELKDAFPVRIEVTKTEHGSQFSLN
ncbi:MAG: SMC family ATPase [Anaerolineae bacterium]|jgi:exonuclease SbcC|nr:SMC family ATPase [Anaerolineae bacterium]